jgi:putative flippase GtrA
VIHETARFGVVGLIGLVVTDGGANLLRYHAGMGRLSSVAVATIASIAITFAPGRSPAQGDGPVLTHGS